MDHIRGEALDGVKEMLEICHQEPQPHPKSKKCCACFASHSELETMSLTSAGAFNTLLYVCTERFWAKG